MLLGSHRDNSPSPPPPTVTEEKSNDVHVQNLFQSRLNFSNYIFRSAFISISTSAGRGWNLVPNPWKQRTHPDPSAGEDAEKRGV